ncbi:lipase 3-like isoform X1 [Leptidea sinapis]|uniref:lipase 3-like isoform X1 n=2 Tax=Leptidea sinapis TaxID=189913 RepID=UPI0021378D6D|nr:lipase 3-like isoform X1 [Leptidea sinapis]
MLIRVSVLFVLCASAWSDKVRKSGVAGCGTHEKILEFGYPAERYDAITSDGYILEVNRIPHGKNQGPQRDRPIVFMMHGLTGCSNSFVELGPKYALGFNFADAGYDVWIGNARGVGNSRRHISLNPDNRIDKYDFFEFTYEDIGLKDLPAMIDFALNHTGQSKIHYIGHSQGGTAFLVLNSMKPEYNDKFIAAHLLAGIGYMNYFPNSSLKRAAYFTNTIYTLARTSGIVEIYGPDWDESRSSAAMSKADNGQTARESLEDIIEELVSDADLIAGSSVKQFAHYGQNINDRKFRRWYYSPLTNLIVYGRSVPPEYDLSKVTVNTIMHYTIGDDLLDERDVISMANAMPNARVRRVAKDDFSHVDFVASSYVKYLVTEYILDDLRRR